MRWVALVCTLAAAVLVGAGGGAPAAPQTVTKACETGSVAAVIAGKHTCLEVGDRCRQALERQYRRYKLSCRGGRLRRLPPVPMTPVTVTLHPLDGSGVTGTAIITPLNAGSIKVTLELQNEPPGDLPAHIHFDPCGKYAPIRYSLSNVIDGKSETTVLTPISYLRRGHGRFSINVHRAEPDLPLIACGDIPQA